MLDARLYQKAVDHNFDGVVLALIELEVFFHAHQFAVDPGAGEAMLNQLLHFLLELALAAANDGSQNHHAVFGLEVHDASDDLIGRLARDGAPALRAMRYANGCIEQAQVIVDLGDRTDGRARTAAGGLLLDRNGRTESIDGVDVGTLHLIEELAGVGGQSLHITPLTFGVNGVKSQGRFARTAETGNHRESIPGNLYIDVLEVMLASPTYCNF